MKKVKVLLSAVAVFGVIGGALAFKARQANFVYVHDTNDTRPAACTLKSFGFTATDNLQPSQALQASSIAITANCKVIPVYPAQ